MSNNEGTNCYNDWIEKSINEEHIKYYEHSNFKDMKTIGNGSFGRVCRATYADIIVALKSFNADKITLKDVINELKLQRKVHYHKNILRFHGITKQDSIEYMLVLEYADSGTLNNYLVEHFNELDWNHKFELSQQLASAVACLHYEDIIHRDLHADNILVHKKSIKLADFGLSRKIVEESSNARIFGVIPYVDPKSFRYNNIKKYKLNKKSDVYSLGVLMWQISSGYRPFNEFDYDISLVLSILDGKRENVIYGTPIEYSALYKECWKYELNERPNIQEVVSTLRTIASIENCDIISNNVEEEQNHLLKKSNSDLKSSKETGDTSSLMLDSNIEFEDIGSKSSSSSQNLSKDSFESTVDNINNVTVEKLITVIIRKHNKEGMVLDQIHVQQILRLNQTSDNLVNWLLKNQVKSQCTFLLGIFYYYDIDIEENSIRALELFSKAADDNCSIAQVYLAKCYIDGYGTECNKNLAFKWYQKSVENKSIIGQFYLGYCYEFGIGIQKNMKESVYWYQRADNCGNIPAKFYLADCYRLGKGIEKNSTKAFEYYEILAKEKFIDAQYAQYQLGNCFYYGIGTQVDKGQAKSWYEQAIVNGNIIAKEFLKKHYTKISQFKLNYFGSKGSKLKKNSYKKVFNYIQKTVENEYKIIPFNSNINYYKKDKGIKEDEKEAFEFYKKFDEQGYISAKFQLGHCYDVGIGTDINKLKAFELYKEAAEKGDDEARFNLSILYELGEGVNKNEKKAFEIIKELAEKGDVDAKYKLANYYYKGIGTEINKSKAFDLNKIAAEKRNTEVRYNLSLLYQLGEGIDKDEKKAFKLTKELAKKEYLNAQFLLGYYYSVGIGTKVNKSKAFELYKIAAKKGDNEAQYHLSLLYQLGEGVSKNEKKAFELMKKLAENEYLEAQFKLGYYYEVGIGTEVNKEKAFEQYKIAAEKGHNIAQYNLGGFI